MRSSWRLTTLGRILSFANGRTSPERDDAGKFKVFGSNGAIGRSPRHNAPANTIVIGRVGSYCGSVHYSSDPCWVTDNAICAVPLPGTHPYFAFGLLRMLDLNRWRAGSGQPLINQSILSSIEVQVPPPQVQASIGRLLSQFDDRIDLLRQTNATLEAIAQALFKSWFIDFDPVRAKAEGREPEGMDAETAALFPDGFEESELGLIPRGWRVGTVRDVCSVFDSKRVPLSGKERAERRGAFPYYGAAALMDHVDDYLFDGVFMLLGEDGSVIKPDGTPVTQYVWGKFWVNNHAHVLQGANGVSTEHLMVALRGMDITPYVTGAVQAKLNQANLFRIPFLLAHPRISEAFGSEVESLYSRLRANAEQVKTLAAIRDVLLPRLVSGKIRVPEADTLGEVVDVL